jgi:uncharacterized membrane protein
MGGLRLPASKRAGLLLGVGLGGFVDGILLHQIVHWHNMGSAVWLMTLVGVYWLLADARRGRSLPDGKAFTGLLILGWGLFNLVEGLVDHHILGVHHVRDLPAHVPLYDWLFLLIGGMGFILLGWRLARSPVSMDARVAPAGVRH